MAAARPFLARTSLRDLRIRLQILALELERVEDPKGRPQEVPQPLAVELENLARDLAAFNRRPQEGK